MNTITLAAPAKINLFLHITGKRVDGYHTLQSLMTFVTAGDELHFAPQNRFELNITGAFAVDLGAVEDNLIYKVAQLLAAHYKINPSGKITLIKNLPVASGIGGGSADAAAALRGLVKLWNLPEEPEQLLRIAGMLGADVPACLYHRPVFAEGIGEILADIPSMPVLHLVLVNPLAATPTPAVFKKFIPGFSAPIAAPLCPEEWLTLLKSCRNDLTAAAIEVTPIIQDVMTAFTTTQDCLLHRLSGSGATCFGIYNNAKESHAAAQYIQSRHPTWWVTATETVSHDANKIAA